MYERLRAKEVKKKQASVKPVQKQTKQISPQSQETRTFPIWGNHVPAELRLAPKASPLQRQTEEKNGESRLHRENTTGLPDALKSGIESLSQLSMDDVKVHYQSSQPAQVQALAYTQGPEIYVGPGQERHLPHEAWHVVQQKQGRVEATMQLQGIAINDDSMLEQEATLMGAKALHMPQSEDAGARTVQVGSGLVAQRAMGMEVETRRAIQTPGGEKIKQGDTKILEHEYFTLVTDKFSGYSNLEFVMKHFDQLSGTQAEAIAELKKRIAAMRNLAGELYANEGKLSLLVTGGIGNTRSDIYKSEQVDYSVDGARTKFKSSDAKIANAPEDDNKLYVHYTVGFEPKYLFEVVKDIQKATRDDTDSARPKTHAENAIAIAPDIVATVDVSTLSDDEKEELRGHLALLYMQMIVFVERTVDLQADYLEDQKESYTTRIKTINKEIKDKGKSTASLRKRLKSYQDNLRRVKKKLADIAPQLAFNKGQPKNKIAALPRASLADIFGALSPNVQGVLTNNKETILDHFSDYIEREFKLDFNEGFVLESPIGEEASLGQYVRAGLTGTRQISQQVLFGGMNEVGIDTSIPGKSLLPLEFRSIFEQRVTWDELTDHAQRILKWSRDPKRNNLPV